MRFTLIILLGLSVWSCQDETSTIHKEHIQSEEVIIEPVTTEWLFDAKITLPESFYLDTIVMYDSAANATYTAYCPKSNSSLPEMVKYNSTIKDAINSRMLYERSFVQAPEVVDGEYDPFFYDYILGVTRIFMDESGSVISIEFVEDSYSFQGAHHNYGSYNFNYNFKMNKQVVITDFLTLNTTEDSLELSNILERNKIQGNCVGSEFTLHGVDFTYTKKGYKFNTQRDYSCGMSESEVPSDSIAKFFN